MLKIFLHTFFVYIMNSCNVILSSTAKKKKTKNVEIEITYLRS